MLPANVAALIPTSQVGRQGHYCRRQQCHRALYCLLKGLKVWNIRALVLDQRTLGLEHLLGGYQSRGTDVACGLEAGGSRARSAKWVQQVRRDHVYV